MRGMKAMLRDRKNGDDLEVFLSAELAHAMASLPESEKVFGYSSRHSIYGAAKNACERAGIEYVPPHQAGRHSFATRLDREGVSPAQIAKWGGWRSVKLVMETYTHPDDDPRRAAEIMSKKGS